MSASDSAEMLAKAPDFLGTALELIHWRGWANSATWAIGPLSLSEAICEAVSRVAWDRDSFLRHQQACYDMVVLAAGVSTIGEVNLLNDAQLPGEGGHWAKRVLLRARELVKGSVNV